MINKIGPSFGSKVYLIDDDYCGTYEYNMASEESTYNQEVLKKAIKKLESNGNDDIVTLKSLVREPGSSDNDLFLLQVKEMRGNSAYIGFETSKNYSTKAILDTYKKAKEDMVEAAKGELADYVI